MITPIVAGAVVAVGGYVGLEEGTSVQVADYIVGGGYAAFLVLLAYKKRNLLASVAMQYLDKKINGTATQQMDRLEENAKQIIVNKLDKIAGDKIHPSILSEVTKVIRNL